MLEFNFSPFPFLHTERLFLRRLSDADAPPLFRLRSDPKVMQFVGRPAPKELREVQDLIDSINMRIDKNESIFWGFESLSHSGLIGTIGFWQILPEHHRAEVGYLLDPDYWGQGIMTEALHAVVDYGFSKMKLHSVQAEIHAKNFASARCSRNSASSEKPISKRTSTGKRRFMTAKFIPY